MNKKLKVALITVGIVAAVVVAVVLGYFGLLKIEQHKVDAIVTETFTSLKTGKFNGEDIFGSMEGEDEVNYQVLLENLNYSIKENKTNFNEASVVLEVSNKDMKQVLGNYFTKAFQLALANAFSETYSEEQLNAEMAKYLEEQARSEEIPNVTTSLTLKMEKQNGVWTLKDDCQDELVNAILPGFNEAIQQVTQMTSAFGE